MNGLLREIGQVAIFLICAQTLLHFRARDSYEKYIKLLISMMLLILMAEPFLDLISMKEGTGFADKIKEYEEELEAVMGKGLMNEEEMESFLLSIMTQKVEQGLEYVQTEQQGLEIKQGEVLENKGCEVEVKQVVIDKIEIGGKNGEP